MKKIYRVKAKKSLRENIQKILPGMYDDFMSYKDRVIGHPLLKTELHRMRITGKPMRYAMEYAEIIKDPKVCSIHLYDALRELDSHGNPIS